MSADLHHQSGLLNQERAAVNVLLSPLYILVEVIAKKLAQVRNGGSVPGDRKHPTRGRSVFPDDGAGRGFHLVEYIAVALHYADAGLHVRLIALHCAHALAQGSEGKARDGGQ